jgi:hypothetical protein
MPRDIGYVRKKPTLTSGIMTISTLTLTRTVGV